MTIVSDKLELGSWKKLPHYSVIGNETSMYVWINEDGRGSNTKWIKGKEAFDLWHRLSKLRKKDKKAFILLCKEIFDKNQKVRDEILK